MDLSIYKKLILESNDKSGEYEIKYIGGSDSIINYETSIDKIKFTDEFISVQFDDQYLQNKLSEILNFIKKEIPDDYSLKTFYENSTLKFNPLCTIQKHVLADGKIKELTTKINYENYKFTRLGQASLKNNSYELADISRLNLIYGYHLKNTNDLAQLILNDYEELKSKYYLKFLIKLKSICSDTSTKKSKLKIQCHSILMTKIQVENADNISDEIFNELKLKLKTELMK